MLVEGLLGAGFDLMPDGGAAHRCGRGATHRSTVAIEPEVTPDPHLGLAVQTFARWGGARRSPRAGRTSREAAQLARKAAEGRRAINSGEPR